METLSMRLPVQRARGVEWSVASRPRPGEVVSGDLHLVAPWSDGILFAVIDGLGHGDEATRAARRAVDVLTAGPGDSVLRLIERCHQALQATRGAAMTLVSVEPERGSATALGIGNVEVVVVRADRHARPPRESVLLRNGVVGYQLPALQLSVIRLAPGDLLVFATDGVRDDFGEGVKPDEPLPQLVERILAQKFRGTDDALILGCRLLHDHEA